MASVSNKMVRRTHITTGTFALAVFFSPFDQIAATSNRFEHFPSTTAYNWNNKAQRKRLQLDSP